MRTHDWANSPLGPPAQWPQPLQTLVGMMLRSHQPMLVIWGSELTFLYNDACATILGANHTKAFGQRCPDGWAEVWDHIEPAVARSLSGEGWHGEIMIPVRHTSASKSVRFRMSCTPVVDASGRVAGSFCTLTEIAEQRDETTERDRLQQMFEQAPGIMALLRGPDHVFEQANAAYRKITGKCDLIGKTVREVMPEVEGQGYFELLEKAYQSGEPLVGHAMPIRFPTGDGSLTEPRLIDFVLQPVRDADGQISALFFVGFDVTEAKRAEEAARETNQRFEIMFDNTKVGICETGMDGRVLRMNAEFRRIMGGDELRSQHFREMTHPDDRERDVEGFRRMMAGEISTYQVEKRFILPDGKLVWVDLRSRLVRDSEGKPLYAIAAIQDITDKKFNEEALRESQKQLRELNERLEAEVAARTVERDRIWQNSSELMGIFGYDGRRKAVNPAWFRVLGHTEESLLNRSMQELIHPDDRELLDKIVQRLLTQGDIVGPFEDRLRHANGSYRTISWTAVPGDEVFYAIGRDVTEQRRTEDALRHAQKMEGVGKLTGGVAHDFNNLLTIIRSSADLLRRQDLSEERRRRYVDAIVSTVERASRLTGQLLAFARKQALKPEIFDARHVVLSTADMLRTIVGSRIRIVTKLTDERAFVEADLTQFETALVNMAVNACDAMDGEGILTIRIEPITHAPAHQGEYGAAFVAIALTDTGSGIAPDKLSHIFEPFFTTKEVGKGTGLGLSQVYGFAKQSGGDVKVESEPGRGTTFTLYLPRTEGDNDVTAPQVPSHLPTEAGHGCRVLVVEDNPEVGRFSTQILEDLGYTTVWATNAAQALRLLSESPKAFDVVFSDVVMPGMSGLDLGCEIRRLYPGLPVVLTSGYSDVLARENRHGFELLQKPYAAEELSRVLGYVMQSQLK